MSFQIERITNPSINPSFARNQVAYDAARETIRESIIALDMHGGLLAMKTIGQAISEKAKE